MKLRTFIFYVTFILMLFFIYLNFPEQNNLYLNGKQIDEEVYQNTIEQWNNNGITSLKDAYMGTENKPLSFLYVQKLLDANPLKTRLLNAVIVIINTYLIFRYTESYKAFLYPIIPIFLNSMWLTVEIIETLFIIIAISLKEYEGIFIGFASIFRPYAVLYTVLVKKNQLKYVLFIVGIFSFILIYNGLFISYAHRLLGYGNIIFVFNKTTDYLAVVFLIVMMYLGSKNKNVFKYGIVASIPLMARMFGHYFLPAYSIFFMASIKK